MESEKIEIERKYMNRMIELLISSQSVMLVCIKLVDDRKYAEAGSLLGQKMLHIRDFFHDLPKEIDVVKISKKVLDGMKETVETAHRELKEFESRQEEHEEGENYLG